MIGALIYHPLSQKAKKPFLLLLNHLFYAIGGVKFLPLLALTVAFNFFAAQKLERTERKRSLLTLVLVLNLGALWVIKYLGFSESCSGCTGVQRRSWLPADRHFALHVRHRGYMIDVYRGSKPSALPRFCAVHHLLPAILSGPIERSKSLLPQFSSCAAQTRTMCALPPNGSSRARSGRLLPADNLGILVITAYADPAQFSGLSWRSPQWRMPCRSTATFPPTRMATGSARLFSITLMENFHAPYMAQSSKEFWHRWHICPPGSATTYISARRQPQGKPRTYINVLIVFALSGLWHGAAMKYALGTFVGVFRLSAAC